MDFDSSSARVSVWADGRIDSRYSGSCHCSFLDVVNGDGPILPRRESLDDPMAAAIGPCGRDKSRVFRPLARVIHKDDHGAITRGATLRVGQLAVNDGQAIRHRDEDIR